MEGSTNNSIHMESSLTAEESKIIKNLAEAYSFLIDPAGFGNDTADQIKEHIEAILNRDAH